jgi:hypothetical protein
MLVCIFLVLAVILYIQSYFKTKNDYTVVQSYLDKVSPDTLHDKHPIVIYDLIHDPKELLTSLFAYSFISAEYLYSKPNSLYKTKSKYTMLYNDASDVMVNIISPKYSAKVLLGKPLEEQNNEIQYVTIKLKQNQVMILPFLWYYVCDKQCKTINLYDILTTGYKLIG